MGFLDSKVGIRFSPFSLVRILPDPFVSFRYIWPSDSSDELSSSDPCGVMLYTFLGLSLSRFHSLFMHPFSSRQQSNGYMVLGPKYAPKFLRRLVIIWYPCMGCVLRSWRTTVSSSPLTSFIWMSFIFCPIIFFIPYVVLFNSCLVIRVYNMSFT